MGSKWCLIAALAVAGCVGSGEVETQVSGQIVGTDGRPLGPGLAIMEKGPVHEGTYERGALIDEAGHFVVTLPHGGQWGFHLFHDDYSYLPGEIFIDDNQQVRITSFNVVWGDWMDRTGLPTWPDQPDDATLIRMPGDDNKADNPVAGEITLSYGDDDLLRIEAEFSDPNGDLSNIVAAYDTATGNAYRLAAPGPANMQGDYPDGIYTLEVYLNENHVPGETVWYFVMSDSLCSNTPILSRVLPPR